MVTLDDSDSEKSSRSDDEQANICLMTNIDGKGGLKTCFEFDTSSCSSPSNEEKTPYDVLL